MEQEDSPVPQSAGREDFGKFQHGYRFLYHLLLFFFFFFVLAFVISNLFSISIRCEHYRRRCRIRAPCCDRIFTCRHCHNEAMVCLSSFYALVLRAFVCERCIRKDFAYAVKLELSVIFFGSFLNFLKFSLILDFAEQS